MDLYVSCRGFCEQEPTASAILKKKEKNYGFVKSFQI